MLPQSQRTGSKSYTIKSPGLRQTLGVYTDASELGYGGAILQEGKPVIFFTRKYQGAEVNYSNIEKELLALIRILTENRTLLYRQRLIVYTDH